MLYRLAERMREQRQRSQLEAVEGRSQGKTDDPVDNLALDLLPAQVAASTALLCFFGTRTCMSRAGCGMELGTSST